MLWRPEADVRDRLLLADCVFRVGDIGLALRDAGKRLLCTAYLPVGASDWPPVPAPEGEWIIKRLAELPEWDRPKWMG